VAVVGPDNVAEISYEPIHCGCVDGDALYVRTLQAEAFIGRITAQLRAIRDDSDAITAGTIDGLLTVIEEQADDS
jgi:hypothetical protein